MLKLNASYSKKVPAEGEYTRIKTNDFLKTDGRKVDVLLPGLGNDYQFRQ